MSDLDYLHALTEQFSIQLEEFLKYDQHRDINQKRFICQYWLRGTCCFTPDFCHFAHGIQYLNYQIDSLTELKPLPSQDEVKLKYKILGFPKQYFVVHQLQSDPEVQEELRQYCAFTGKVYDPNRVYTLKEIQFEKSVKAIILNTLYLREIKNFYFKILELLKVDTIPKAVLVHELNRVGYSFMGSHFARPKTLIFHLENSGVCFQKLLSTDIVLKGYDESILRKQMSLKVLKDGLQQTQELNEKKNNEEIDKEDIEEIEDDEDVQDFYESLECKEGIKEIQYIVLVKDKTKLIEMFNLKLNEILQNFPEMANYKDIDDFSFKIFDNLQQFNQTQFEKNDYILPSLSQVLTILNCTWEEYAQKYGFEKYQFTNSRESGINIELIIKNFTPEQKLELEQYLQKPRVKYFLCQYWMRGICIFQKKDCRFAHGLDDLELNFDIKRDFNNMEKEQRPLRYNQKPLINHRTYRILYLHQYKMIEDGVLNLTTKASQLQIDNCKEYRDKIREHIQKLMIIQMYQKISNGQPQLKSEITKYFLLAGFIQRGVDLSELKIVKILLNNNFVFEKESVLKVHLKQDQQQETLSKKERQKATQKQILLIPVKNYIDYNKYYQNLIFQALENILQEKVSIPIEESILKKELYKLDQDIEMPGLYQFFLRHPIKKYTLIDYFQEQILGQVKNKLKDKIHPEVYQEISEDAFNLIQFEADIGSLMILIEAIYGNIIQKNQICLNFNKIINQIEMKASDNDKYNCLVTYLYKEKQHNFISINGNLYSLNQNNQNQIQKIKKCKCGKSYQQPSFIKQINQNKLLTKIIEYQIFKDKDVRNTIIIDTPEKLLLTQEFFESDVDYVAVDLEGNLRKGDIWLTQLGVQAENQRLIFIFDFMKIKYLEADLIFHNQMMNVLKQIIENQEICKVFHDCKRDSQALHQNLICPQNIVDTSCTYQLLEYLKFNNQKDTKKIKNAQQISKEILQISTPPINSVLTKFGALHGGNELKEEMHAKFKQPQGEDFFVRPNPAFMYYSARDVEDLVQVYLEMEKKASNWRYVIEKMSNKNKEFYIKTL